MGAINTSYTFEANDAITSTKMNNIIDQTVVTDTAISGSTLEVTTSGQLRIRAQGITSNEMGSSSVMTTALTDSSVTQAKIALNVAGRGPAFRATNNVTVELPPGVRTKVRLDVENFDTNSNFDSVTNFRFTPNIAGYYQINCQLYITALNVSLRAYFYKNGSEYLQSQSQYVPQLSDLIYFNGSSDYLELYADHSSSSTQYLFPNPQINFLSGFLASAT